LDASKTSGQAQIFLLTLQLFSDELFEHPFVDVLSITTAAVKQGTQPHVITDSDLGKV
jgi:hypothetical protein